MLTRFLNPRLRFIVEGEADGGEEVVEPAAPEAPEEPTSGGNPNWEGIRSQLDPISFSKIEAELTKMDQAANSRVQSSNEALRPYKQFTEQGVTPDLIQTALALQQRIDANPVEIYQYLGKFLSDTGRMPTNTEIKQAEASGEITSDDETTPASDPRIDAIAQQQQQIIEFFQNQEAEAANANSAAQAEANLDTEVNGLKAAHPELSDADVSEIMGRAAFVAQSNFAQGREVVPSLEDTYGWFSDLRNRFLSTPRAGDSAPRLLPTSGGLSSSAPTPVGQWTSQQVQDYIAAQLTRG